MVPKSDVNVSLAGGQLWISGERKGAPDADDRSFYVLVSAARPVPADDRAARDGGSFDRITATVEDGLLEIVVKGCAVADDHEQIEIAGADSTEVRLDVAGDGMRPGRAGGWTAGNAGQLAHLRVFS